MKCKESLVSSACGDDTGKLAFHILRLDAVKDMNKKPCIITRKSNYESKYQNLCTKLKLQFKNFPIECSIAVLRESKRCQIWPQF